MMARPVNQLKAILQKHITYTLALNDLNVDKVVVNFRAINLVIPGKMIFFMQKERKKSVQSQTWLTLLFAVLFAVLFAILKFNQASWFSLKFSLKKILRRQIYDYKV